METAYDALGDIGMRDELETIIAAAEDGDFEDARGDLDDLLYDEGYEGEEVLSELLAAVRSRCGGDELARVHALAGEIEFELAQGTSDRVHLGRLLAELGR
jgi:replication factor C small subunit